MDDDGGLGIRNSWNYFDQPRNLGPGNLGLHLSTLAERDITKPLLSNGGFLHHPEQSVPMEFMRDGWIHHSRENKQFLNMFQMSHHHGSHLSHHGSYGVLPPDPPGAPTLQMMHPPDPPEDDQPLPPKEEPKKRSQSRPNKLPKPKKPKKASTPRDKTANVSVSRVKAGKKNTDLVINGIDMDISGISTPVCSCTGSPQQCYRWGIGGWQSACCTTNMSEYPLPMSTKRRGARIAGRKMSQGAFKKVLEKLAGEGYNLSNPIDLKMYWAKHGTNKFVTIR